MAEKTEGTRSSSAIAVVSVVIAAGALAAAIVGLCWNRRQDQRSEVDRYNLNALSFRPELGCSGDFEPTLVQIKREPGPDEELADAVPVSLKVSGLFHLTNRGTAPARLVGFVVEDTVTGQDVLRSMLRDSRTVFRQAPESLAGRGKAYIRPGESRELPVEHVVKRPTTGGAFEFHVLLVYENEMGCLYDTYFWMESCTAFHVAEGAIRLHLPIQSPAVDSRVFPQKEAKELMSRVRTEFRLPGD